MTEAGKSIIRGLEQAIAYAKGEDIEVILILLNVISKNPQAVLQSLNH